MLFWGRLVEVVFYLNVSNRLRIEIEFVVVFRNLFSLELFIVVYYKFLGSFGK